MAGRAQTQWLDNRTNDRHCRNQGQSGPDHKALNKRDIGDFSSLIGEIVETDKAWRAATARFEDLRAQQRAASAKLAAAKKSGATKKDPDNPATPVRELATQVKESERQASAAREKLDQLLLQLPNSPDDDIVAGGKEANTVISVHNPTPAFNFPPKDHVDLCRQLRLIDYYRGVKIAGRGNWLYRGAGARLEWALLNYFVSEHVKSRYDFVLPPHLLNYQSGVGAGQFPKFEDDVYMMTTAGEPGQRHFLLPTSETALINIFSGEILPEELLPVRLFSYSPCYRREAGAHRSAERGTVRGRQFNKVEMFHFAHPDESGLCFEELLAKASGLVNGLGLHFRVSKLAAGDISASMCRTYDIEVLIPSLGYKEVSSVSNARAYQARRANVRFRPADSGKPKFVHTLNGSGLATSRLLPAIVEQFQNADGSVDVPEVLRGWVGSERLDPDPKGW